MKNNKSSVESEKKLKSSKKKKEIRPKKVKKIAGPESFLIHESELIASRALKAVPRHLLIEKIGRMTENLIQIDRLANCIKLGSEQFSKIYDMLVRVCDFFKIPVPNLFLEMNVVPKSNVMGIEEPNIVLTSGLIDFLTDEEIETEIAHCVGHILCNHFYYQTIADTITNLGLGPVGSVLYYPFFYWKNCIEFSADRAAMVYLQRKEPLVKLLLKYAGVTEKISGYVNVDLILKQAEQIARSVKGSEAFAKLSGKSPILRIYETEKWFGGSMYNEVVDYFKNQKVLISQE